MGKLRTEPKQKSFLSQEEYKSVVAILREAQRAALEYHVFWELDPEEKAAQVKKKFNFVARKEGIDVTIRQVRGTRSLSFKFSKARGNSRMSAEESQARILKCLKNAGQPMKKNEIIRDTGISASTWNIRIKELLKSNKVIRHGERRDTTYTAK